MSLLEILLLPFSWLYGGIMQFRNYLYDSDIKKSFHFDTCTISVGNLSVGGSGKTPMIEYLIRLLGQEYRIATLSRGYGRKTKGFRLAGESDSARTLGDEPYQYFTKFPDITVTVGEERALAIPFILAESPGTDIILLDDAFQHRSVKPDFQLLVSEYSRPFYSDHVMPAGRLRETRAGASRADAIIFSKCPSELTPSKRQEMTENAGKYSPGTPVYFTTIDYLPLTSVTGGNERSNVLLVTGIANPAPLVTYLQQHYTVDEHLMFPDHHTFTKTDVDRIIQKLKHGNKLLVTTEKDLMRLQSANSWSRLKDFPVYYIPIKVRFLFEEDKFDDMILKVAESRCS